MEIVSHLVDRRCRSEWRRHYAPTYRSSRSHLYFGKSLNPLKTSNLEVLEVLDRFRGIRTLEGLEVLRDMSPGCSTGVQLKQFYTSIVISQQRVKRELRVPWLVEEQNATKQN